MTIDTNREDTHQQIIRELRKASHPTISVHSNRGEVMSLREADAVAAKGRSLFVADQTLEVEKWQGQPIEVDKTEPGTTWHDFCEEKGLTSPLANPFIDYRIDTQSRGDIDFPNFLFNTSKLRLPSKSKINFANLTKLQGFGLRVVMGPDLMRKTGGDVKAAVAASSKILKMEGGWCSDNRFAYDFPEQQLVRDPMSLVVVADHPGQGLGSQYIHPEDINSDLFLATLAQSAMATDAAYKLFGLDNHTLTHQMNKQVVKIGHSRKATTLLFSTDIKNDAIKTVFAEPVSSHAGLKPKIAEIGLPFMIQLGDMLSGNTVGDAIVKPVKQALVNGYSGPLHTVVNPIYGQVYDATDPNVIRAHIGHLMQTSLPNLDGVVSFDPKRHMILVSDSDSFVDSSKFIEGMPKQLGSTSLDVLKEVKGDHNGLITDGEAAFDHNIVENQEMVLDFINQ